MKAASLLGELVEYGIITIDKEGALGVCNGKIIEFPAPSVKVIDPSGAGDVFWGSFMGCLISAKDFRKAMKASIKMAVRNIMHIGTSAFINIE